MLTETLARFGEAHAVGSGGPLLGHVVVEGCRSCFSSRSEAGVKAAERRGAKR